MLVNLIRVSTALRMLLDAGVLEPFTAYQSWDDTYAVPEGGDTIHAPSTGAHVMAHDVLGGYLIRNPHGHRSPFGWGDYDNSTTVERSNHRAIIADHPSTFIEVTWGFNGHDLAVPLTFNDEEAAEIIISLCNDNSIYSDEDVSALEMELAEEAWDQYLSMDIRREINKVINGPDRDDYIDVEDYVREDTLRQWFYDLCVELEVTIEGETATNVIFRGQDEVETAIIERVRSIIDHVDAMLPQRNYPGQSTLPIDAPADPRYCRHNRYVGTPTGPDYICGDCEDGR